jgi:tetratricopeptide (TPR) repeat protein
MNLTNLSLLDATIGILGTIFGIVASLLAIRALRRGPSLNDVPSPSEQPPPTGELPSKPQDSEDDKSVFPRVSCGAPQLPFKSKSLIGRDELLGEIKQRLLSNNNVVLLGGVPGCGKTELAIHLKEDKEISKHFKDGLLWVSLGDGLNETGVYSRLSKWGNELGVEWDKMPGGDPETLATSIRDVISKRRILLVIDDAWDTEQAWTFRLGGDNCAHLLTTRFPKIAYDFLDPGQSPIKVTGLDDDDAARKLLAQYVPTVVDQRKDEIEKCIKTAGGLPLSLVIIGSCLRYAEARPHKLDEALEKAANAESLFDEPLPEQDRRQRTNAPRSLFAIIQMSKELLDQTAQDALLSLTVFPPKVNTFSYRAGETVAGSSEALDEIWERGLTEVIETEIIDPDADNKRYTMHMAIWAFAESARKGYDVESAYERMANHFIDYIKEWENSGKSKTLLLDSLEQEHQNLQEALEKLIEYRKASLGLRLARALWKFWYERSHFSEGRKYTEDLCKLPGSEDPELRRVRAEVINNAGNLAYNQGELKEAEAKHRQSLSLRQQIGDKQGEAGSLNNLGLLYRERGDYVAAKQHFREALEINRHIQHKDWTEWSAKNLNGLGTVAALQGDGPTAQKHQEESLKLFKDLQDEWGIAMALSDLGTALFLQGKHTQAAAWYKKSLALRQRIKDPRGIASTLRGLAGLTMTNAPCDLATNQYKAALVLSKDLGDWGGMMKALQGLARTASACGEVESTVRFYAGADTICRNNGFKRSPAARTVRARELAGARDALGGELFRQVWKAATDAPLDAVINEALAKPPPPLERVIERSLNEEGGK